MLPLCRSHLITNSWFASPAKFTRCLACFGFGLGTIYAVDNQYNSNASVILIHCPKTCVMRLQYIDLSDK